MWTEIQSLNKIRSNKKHCRISWKIHTWTWIYCAKETNPSSTFDKEWRETRHVTRRTREKTRRRCRVQQIQWNVFISESTQNTQSTVRASRVKRFCSFWACGEKLLADVLKSLQDNQLVLQRRSLDDGEVQSASDSCCIPLLQSSFPPRRKKNIFLIISRNLDVHLTFNELHRIHRQSITRSV